MPIKKLRVFFDTSVIFAAVLSSDGGARRLFQLAEVGVLRLLVSPSVLREAEEVVRRKAPSSLPALAQLLHAANAETCSAATAGEIKKAHQIVQYLPDAHVLAEAIHAKSDWFVTHDKEHFLKKKKSLPLDFPIGTPGDLLQKIRDDFYAI
jgi:predicted nucleic acid-binding protein